jgi:hypothetical protein
LNQEFSHSQSEIFFIGAAKLPLKIPEIIDVNIPVIIPDILSADY